MGTRHAHRCHFLRSCYVKIVNYNLSWKKVCIQPLNKWGGTRWTRHWCHIIRYIQTSIASDGGLNSCSVLVSQVCLCTTCRLYFGPCPQPRDQLNAKKHRHGFSVALCHVAMPSCTIMCFTLGLARSHSAQRYRFPTTGTSTPSLLQTWKKRSTSLSYFKFADICMQNDVEIRCSAAWQLRSMIQRRSDVYRKVAGNQPGADKIWSRSHRVTVLHDYCIQMSFNGV